MSIRLRSCVTKDAENVGFLKDYVVFCSYFICFSSVTVLNYWLSLCSYLDFRAQYITLATPNPTTPNNTHILVCSMLHFLFSLLLPGWASFPPDLNNDRHKKIETFPLPETLLHDSYVKGWAMTEVKAQIAEEL